METKDKFMLTIKEATPYFSIGQKKLRRIAENSIIQKRVWMSRKGGMSKRMATADAFPVWPLCVKAFVLGC